jgi:hypothetical protein
MTKLSKEENLFEIWNLEFIPQKAMDKFCILGFVIWNFYFFIFLILVSCFLLLDFRYFIKKTGLSVPYNFNIIVLRFRGTAVLRWLGVFPFIGLRLDFLLIQNLIFFQ